MKCVIDASFAVQMAVNPSFVGKGKELFLNASLVLAPSLFISELTNTFWKYYTFGSLSREQCVEGVNRSLNLADTIIDDRELTEEAFHQACNLRHPVYDILYLVLARRNGATLLSLDKKLQTLAKKEGIDV